MRIFTDSGAVDFVFGYKIVPPEPVDKTGMAISGIAIAAVGCVAIAFTAYWIAARKRKDGENKAC